MIRTLRSNASQENPRFVRLERHGRANNLALLEQALSDRAELRSAARTPVLLVGGRSATALRLRVSQSHIRHDLTPSAWSDAAMLATPGGTLGETPLYEISLEPVKGFGFVPPSNAVQTSTLARYRDSRLYPNIALISLPVPSDIALAALDNLRPQRTVIDLPELLVAWLGFTWGVGRAANPLFDGLGIPSAVLLESVLAAAGPHAFELTPGLASRSSCPEAIYQAARWWHTFYEQHTPAAATAAGSDIASQDRLPIGVWCAGDDLCLEPK